MARKLMPVAVIKLDLNRISVPLAIVLWVI